MPLCRASWRGRGLRTRLATSRGFQPTRRVALCVELVISSQRQFMMVDNEIITMVNNHHYGCQTMVNNHHYVMVKIAMVFTMNITMNGSCCNNQKGSG